ncbi:MAG: hypothetical protein ACI4QM_00395 [Alphaproteobacteria bacterium]
MKKLVLTVAALAMLGACSSTPNTDPWIGRSEDEVISRLGLPMRTYKSNDRKYLVYDLSREHKTTGCHGLYSVSGFGYVSPVPCGCGAFVAGGCQTMFILDDGEVENWKTTGRCGY